MHKSGFSANHYQRLVLPFSLRLLLGEDGLEGVVGDGGARFHITGEEKRCGGVGGSGNAITQTVLEELLCLTAASHMTPMRPRIYVTCSEGAMKPSPTNQKHDLRANQDGPEGGDTRRCLSVLLLNCKEAHDHNIKRTGLLWRTTTFK